MAKIDLPLKLTRTISEDGFPTVSISYNKEDNSGIDTNISGIRINNTTGEYELRIRFSGVTASGKEVDINETCSANNMKLIDTNESEKFSSFKLDIDDQYEGFTYINNLMIYTNNTTHDYILDKIGLSIAGDSLLYMPVYFYRYPTPGKKPSVIWSSMNVLSYDSLLSTVRYIVIWSSYTLYKINVVTDSETFEVSDPASYSELHPYIIRLNEPTGNLSIDIESITKQSVGIQLLQSDRNTVYCAFNAKFGQPKISAAPTWESVTEGKKLTLKYNNLFKFSDIHNLEINSWNKPVNISIYAVNDGYKNTIAKNIEVTPDDSKIIHNLVELIYDSIEIEVSGPKNAGISVECNNEVSGGSVNTDSAIKYFIEGEGIFYSEDIKLEPSSGIAGDTEVTVTVPESTSFNDTTNRIGFVTAHNKRASLTIKRDGRPIYIYDNNSEYRNGSQAVKRVNFKEGVVNKLQEDLINYMQIGKTGVAFKYSFFTNDERTYYVTAYATLDTCLKLNIYEFKGDTFRGFSELTLYADNNKTLPLDFDSYRSASMHESGDYIFILGIANSGIVYFTKEDLVTLYIEADNEIIANYVKLYTDLFTGIVETPNPDRFMIISNGSMYYYILNVVGKTIGRVPLHNTTVTIIDATYNGTDNVVTTTIRGSNNIFIYIGDGSQPRVNFLRKAEINITGASMSKINYNNGFYILHTVTNLYILDESFSTIKNLSEDCIYDVYCTGNNVLIARLLREDLGDVIGVKYIDLVSNPEDVVELNNEYDSEYNLLSNINSEILVRDF